MVVCFGLGVVLSMVGCKCENGWLWLIEKWLVVVEREDGWWRVSV